MLQKTIKRYTIKHLQLLFIALIFSIGAAAQMAHPEANIELRINDQKIDLLKSELSIDELKNANIQLYGKVPGEEAKPVGIDGYKVMFSTKDYDVVGNKEAEGVPSSDLTEYLNEGATLEPGMKLHLRLSYTIDYIDEDGYKETTWMMNLSE